MSYIIKYLLKWDWGLKMYYVQCKLEHSSGKILTSWIPEKFAVKGKYLEIKIDNNWENHWLIKETYAKQKEEYLLEKERDYLKQRNASDV